MRFTPLLLVIALGACTGSIEKSQSLNGGAIECQRRLAGTMLPVSYQECTRLGYIEDHPAGSECWYWTANDGLYEACMRAAGWKPHERVSGGSVKCAVVFTEDDACGFDTEVLEP